MQNTSNTPLKIEFNSLVDTLVKLLILYLLLSFSADILGPFIIILVWGGIIAIATYPLFLLLKKLFKGRSIISAVLLTITMLSVLIIPSWLVIDSLLHGLRHLRTLYESGSSIIPPPGEATKTWPGFAAPFLNLWADASDNIAKVMQDHAAQTKSAALWTFDAFSNFGKGLLQFVASTIVAGIFYVYSETIHSASHSFFSKLAGDRGEEFLNVSVDTIRNVVKGILGVALIQATMAGLGFFAAGIPFAGLWTVLSLVLAIVQIGAGPVIVPVIIYSFTVDSTTSAVLLTIWLSITMVIDNVLKPVLLGRNAPAPMLVIFLGAIGGFISHGFVGLFLGAVILTLAYKLLGSWIGGGQIETEASTHPTEQNTTASTP